MLDKISVVLLTLKGKGQTILNAPRMQGLVNSSKWRQSSAIHTSHRSSVLLQIIQRSLTV